MSGETLIQQASRQKQQKYENEQGKLGAFAGRVVSVQPTSDEIGMTYGPAPERRMSVQHPFVGSTSWIRSMPEVGTLFLMQTRFDSGQPEPVKTIPVNSALRAEDYRKALNTYRSISSGEHDLASTGYAFLFMGRRGDLDLRSGASVKFQMSRENQQLTSRAPTTRHELTLHTSGQMGDEVRTGIVKRWSDSAQEYYVKKNDKFTSEDYIQIKNPSGSGPAVLLRHIEGHVYDDAGREIKHPTTALPLRSHKLWYTTTDEATRRDVDQNGNMYLEFPQTASTGYEVLIPQGSYRKTIGKDRNISIAGDEIVLVQKDINYTVNQNVTYDVTKNVTINSGENLLAMDVAAGSVTYQNPSGYGIVATDAGGGQVNITGPGGSSMSMQSTGATSITAKQTLSLTVDQIMTMSGMILQGNFSLMNLGVGAAIPAVLGLTMQAYVDQHQHTISGFPTSPPNIPSSSFNGTPQSILSVKILMMANA